MNVLITGGAGFIGSHTVRALVRRGDEVRVLDDLSTGRRSRLADVEKEISFLEGDIRDPGTVDASLQGVSHVLHLAAVPSVFRSVQEPLLSHDVNATGTVGLLEGCRRAGVRRVVVASSSSVYGDQPDPGPKEEGLQLRPASPYAASKLATESYALAWSRTFDVEAVALRYFNVFGPDQDPESEYAAVIPRFITAALGGEVVTVHGDGEQTRDFTYVGNVVSANLLALEARHASGEAVNVACGVATSVNQLVEEIGRCHKRPLKAVHGPPRPGDVRRSHASLSRAVRLLGYRPDTPFTAGLQLTFDSFSHS